MDLLPYSLPPLARFLLQFFFFYALLIVPWPGLENDYQAFYRSLGNAVFGGEAGLFVDFQPNTEKVWPPNFDTLIIVADRKRLDAFGNGPLIRLGLDTRQLGWISIALFLALTLSVPICLRRRLIAAGVGLFWIHFYILISVWIYIENESTRLALVKFSPGVKELANGVEKILVGDPVGSNLAVPILVFVLVTFRADDPWFRKAVATTKREFGLDPIKTSSAALNAKARHATKNVPVAPAATAPIPSHKD